jgi:hypothetical protein
MDISKHILPVVAGAVAGMVLIGLGEGIIHHAFPLPPGTDVHDHDSLEQAMSFLPASVFIWLLINYFIASLLAGLTATILGKRITMQPAIIVGIVLLLSGLFNLLYLPHPLWFVVLNLILYVPAAYLGYLLVKK